jgi:SAM-dependent methyltransferase
MNDATSPDFEDPAGTWNRRYARDDYLFGVEPNEWLSRHAGRWNPGHRVLCVADGEGRNSVWLAEQGLAVDAFDIAAHGVDKARRLARLRGVSVNFSVADCDTFDWAHEAYDGVAAIFIQFAPPALRARLFERMLNCLKPGGLLVLQGYTPRQLEYRTGGPPCASHLYTEAMLRDALGGLDVLELQTYDAVITEGSGHQGLSALIGLVGRKR